MPRSHRLLLASAALLTVSAVGGADVTVDRNVGDAATEAFRFPRVPAPHFRGAIRAFIAVVDGVKDEHCGRDAVYLSKARVPLEPDDPAENFFFQEGTDGGRLRIDLWSAVPVGQVNTYSWHPGSRGPQVYVLYGADGSAAGFDPAPRKGIDPTTCGWRRLASVDTRPAHGRPGGQYGVNVSDPSGTLGTFRYLLMDVSRTEDADGFGNTFYSKIDVVAPAGATTGPSTVPATRP